VVVNLSSEPAQARVHLPWDGLADRMWTLDDRLSGEQFVRAGGELATEGLYVALDPWGLYFLAFTA
jgi:hypothetical protein